MSAALADGRCSLSQHDAETCPSDYGYTCWRMVLCRVCGRLDWSADTWGYTPLRGNARARVATFGRGVNARLRWMIRHEGEALCAASGGHLASGRPQRDCKRSRQRCVNRDARGGAE